jgi:hypothetical protein
MSDRIVTGVLGSTDPQFTTRITVKNPYFATTGHAYESTVEVVYTCSEEELDDVAAVAREHLRDQLKAARQEGISERDARNKADNRV